MSDSGSPSPRSSPAPSSPTPSELSKLDLASVFGLTGWLHNPEEMHNYLREGRTVDLSNPAALPEHLIDLSILDVDDDCAGWQDETFERLASEIWDLSLMLVTTTRWSRQGQRVYGQLRLTFVRKQICGDVDDH